MGLSVVKPKFLDPVISVESDPHGNWASGGKHVDDVVAEEEFARLINERLL